MISKGDQIAGAGKAFSGIKPGLPDPAHITKDMSGAACFFNRVSFPPIGRFSLKVYSH
jgi:hypothetical protein